MRLKSDYIEPLYNLTHILKAKNILLDDFKITIEKLFAENQKASYSIIADLFYDIGYYETALEYIRKCENAGLVTESTTIFKIRCLVRSGEFEEIININDIDEKSSYYMTFSMYKVISAVLINECEDALSIVKNFKEDTLSSYDKKLLSVYSEAIKLFTNESTSMLIQDENEKEYMNIILEILEILLINNKFDELKIAVNLFNLIDNKSALLYLGKLYYKYNYIDIAKKEILRSIKEFDIYDNEALDILKR